MHRFPGLFCFIVVMNIAPLAVGAEKPYQNVVLFLVDDMGWMDSSEYGSTYYETPHMEQLATQSMKFTDAYALPLCSPTRASILTGQYSSRHGITSATGHRPPLPKGASYLPETAPANQPLLMPISKNYLDPEQYTLAEALRDAGYATAHIGKWHLGLKEQNWPEQNGFDVAFHAEPSPGPPQYFSPYGTLPPGSKMPKRKKGERAPTLGTITDGPDGEYITDRVTDEAIAFMKEHRDEPFFLNLWHFAVHGPWGHKEEYTAKFAEKTDPSGQQGNPIMASMLQSVDESLGRILASLDELGLADNTLFIFYSDNGGNNHSNTPNEGKSSRKEDSEQMKDWRKWAGNLPPTNNAPLREGKGRIWEGGQRVPLMVRWPGHIKPHTTSDAVVGPIDLYPTIFDALNLELPSKQIIDGESILPVLEQTGELKRNAYFTWFPHLTPGVSVRQGPWKLIRHFPFRRVNQYDVELFNLSDDIGETNNLAEAMPEKVRELNTLIDQFVEETGALYPQPNPNYQARVRQKQ
ncbi:sulfatase [Calycomorphotria hydatis]|uniref:Arylsulfatase n=1 Tax=Calycomorphotria hydatis TaxID=2528027 RepID=A0A517TEX8_9PLAN|nr:sulfatase [Calycomorphotria hydatis]QDT66919.1 Arylsulfatase [Calycomorphotria hydatis]